MALTITNTTLSDTITKTEIQQNFSDVVSKFGNIDNSDIKAAAAIAITKLQASKEYMSIQLTVPLAAGGLAGSAGDVMALAALPGGSDDDDQANWKVAEIAWVCGDIGAGTGKVDVMFGGLTTAGAWDTGTDVELYDGLTLAKMDAGASTNTAGGGNLNVTATTVSFNATRARFFALLLDTADTTACTGFPLVVTILLERDIQVGV
jgi:hypothetical protein